MIPLERRETWCARLVIRFISSSERVEVVGWEVVKMLRASVVDVALDMREMTSVSRV